MKGMLYPPQKKKTFKKKRKQSYTSKDKCPNFTNFFRTSKSSNSNLSNGKKRKLSPFMRLLRKEQQKYLQNIYKINYLLKIMLYISSWTLILMLYIRQSIYLVLTNVSSASFLMFHITFDEISTTLSIQFW